MDQRLCPLCQQPNVCGNLQTVKTGVQVSDPAMPAGGSDFDCWCLHQPVSTVALEKLPPGQRGQSCLCQACATGSD